MQTIRIMSYNIEHMRDLFYKGKLNPEKEERIEAIVHTISKEAPHILGIVEAADKLHLHEQFIEETALNDLTYSIGKSEVKRWKQDLVFYYRDPIELISIDPEPHVYDQWIEDIDHDGIKEVCEFERKPLEGKFKIKNTNIEFLVILVATKSKGVFSVNDIIRHQYLAIANRKRLLAQSKKIRSRIDSIMENNPTLPIIVMGDFNDEPGMDSYERFVGASSLDTIMGSVYEPDKILFNALWHMTKDDKLKKDAWTTAYPDLIVQNHEMHKGWLDHILVSPNMQRKGSSLQLIQQSGMVAQKTDAAKLASDHFPVYCDLSFDL